MDFIPCTEDKNGVSGMDHLPAKEEKIEEKAKKSAFQKENKIVSFLMDEVHCKMCNSGLDMQVLKGKSGLAITFVLKCFACPYRVEFCSSNFHEETQITTIKTRFVYAMCSIGKGAEAGRMLCGKMNLPQPPTRFSPYGDEDCKAFDAVKKKNIYGNEYPIEKLECIGHVMKRMGTRLR
ncbi:uncharacterized protein TNCV_2880051 [Trichonephila clavipes]|uniref:Mutator-like transposase domain-containing protein n=1 Tax=Trichonephila clavipes TaxID=2585209 RepID=A0A8X6W1Q8_TRICX|nr:uncharacterized protein TNCV_2880051 [Trichonephila clavipes]